MKLSFSVHSAKPQSKPKQVKRLDDPWAAEDETAKGKLLITEFDPSKPAPASTPVIPPIQNEWKPIKKMKNLHLPTAADTQSLAFELAADPHAHAHAPESDMSYGLNLRNNKQDGGHDGLRLLRRPVPVEATMLHKLKDDLERLPEDQGFEEFKDVPVEGFGAALLAGYGWKEGMGIGKNAKEDVKVVQIKRRTDKEGLGFVGDAPAPLVRPNYDRDNNNIKDKDKEKVVRIVGGRDVGLKGSVVSRIGLDYLVLELSRSGEKVKVKVKVEDVAELGSKEEERCLRRLKAKRGRDEVEEKRGDGSRREERTPRDERRLVDHRKLSWLTSHIRVRVISRDFKGGRFYLKKGQILDVVGPTTCDISMDESREIVQGVSQDVLETAIPKRGGPVLVLAGKYKGVFGSLMERDFDRETAIVRDADTHNLLNVKLEQIAEYLGDPSLLGH